jgi:hypothetical protein
MFTALFNYVNSALLAFKGNCGCLVIHCNSRDGPFLLLFSLQMIKQSDKGLPPNLKHSCSMKKLALSPLALLLLATSPLLGNLELVLDFGNSRLSGGNINNITSLSATTSNLKDYLTGEATSISVTPSGWSYVSGVHDDSWSSGTKDWVIDSIGDDFFFDYNADGAGVVSFGGIEDGFYQVEILSTSISQAPASWIVNDHDTILNYNNTAGVDSTAFNPMTEGKQPGNWLIWDNVVVGPGHPLVVQAFDGSSAQKMVVLNGIRVTQIGAIPEPATVALISGSAILGFAIIRRRRH